MRYRIYLTVFFIFIALKANSQTIMDVARSKEITWYGIDFSKAKFIGFEKEITPSLLKDELIPQWARLTEETNFDAKYKTKVTKVSDTAVKRNIAVNKENLMTGNFYEIHPDSITAVLSNYKITGTGYGFIYIVESFEKTTDKVYIYVCFFNEIDKKIISMRRYIGKASGAKILERYKVAIFSIIISSSKDFKRYKKK